MIPLPTFYKPIIEVQMPLYKTDGVVLSHLYNFLVSILKWYILLISLAAPAPSHRWKGLVCFVVVEEFNFSEMT